MTNKIKMTFCAALAAGLISMPVAHAASSDATLSIPTNTAAAPASGGDNVDSTMTRLFGDPVIAKGRGVQIKQSDLDQVMTGLKSSAAAHGQTIPPEQLTDIEGEMLTRLIDIQLLMQKATDADKAEGKKKADAQIADLLDRAGSQTNLDDQLQAAGMDMSQLRAKITQEATAQAVLARELGIKVTDAEAKQFYDDHPAEFEQPEMVHVRHILMLTIDPKTHQPLSKDQIEAKHKQMEDLLKRIHDGASFATLARQYSEDPNAKENGGEITFSRDNPQVPPEFADAAFSLQTNQVSDVIQTSYGYHIIKLLNKIPAKKIEYATVADKIKDFLIRQKTGKLAQPYLARLEKAADVQIVDPTLKAAVQAAKEAAEEAATNTSGSVPDGGAAPAAAGN
jgi:peptidyl-prolyl cis-trans isomerase C